MNKFTEGIWEVKAIYGDHYVVFAKGQHTVANCFGSNVNARLIAAAPEMYEVLRVWGNIGVEPVLMETKARERRL